jgi:hypothetical protein
METQPTSPVCKWFIGIREDVIAELSALSADWNYSFLNVSSQLLLFVNWIKFKRVCWRNTMQCCIVICEKWRLSLNFMACEYRHYVVWVQAGIVGNDCCMHAVNECAVFLRVLDFSCECVLWTWARISTQFFLWFTQLKGGIKSRRSVPQLKGGIKSRRSVPQLKGGIKSRRSVPV